MTYKSASNASWPDDRHKVLQRVRRAETEEGTLKDSFCWLSIGFLHTHTQKKKVQVVT